MVCLTNFEKINSVQTNVITTPAEVEILISIKKEMATFLNQEFVDIPCAGLGRK